jgi:hypothetical protein
MALMQSLSTSSQPQAESRFVLTATHRRLITAAALLLFLLPVLWQANRAPRIGDIDTIRVGLLALNRAAPETFPGDIAMQTGTWWPGYTPAYIGFLSAGYQLIGDFETLMLVLTVVAYVSLLTGFYCLGHKLNLPWESSLALMLLSGLYIPTALGHSWTGIRLEMAAARNLYLALFPWLMWLGLHFYRTSPSRFQTWLFYGLLVGLAANLHSINGITIIGALLVMMLVGIVKKHFSWVATLAFALGSLPGLLKIYLDTYVTYAEITTFFTDATQGQIIRLDTTVYNDVTRLNLFFYRLPTWNIPIVIFALLTIAGLLLLWRSGDKTGWIMFGLAQFFGAALILTMDWFVLLAAAFWIVRVLRREHTETDRLALCFLFAVNLLALLIGWVFSNLSGALSMPSLLVPARSFLRGGAFVYPALVILIVISWRDLLRQSFWRGITLLLVVILGFHDMARTPPLEAIPVAGSAGQWLPVDIWTYAGIFLLVVWPLLEKRSQIIQWGWLAVLAFQAVTRLLGAPADDSITLIIGVIVAVGMWVATSANRQSTGRRLAIGGAAAILILFMTLPLNGRSTVADIFANARSTLYRSWSRQDTWSLYYEDYFRGQWIQQNTPPASLILTGDTFARYWMQRPIVIGSDDHLFFHHAPAEYERFYRETQAQAAAYQSPEKLLQYAWQHQVDYIVVPRTSGLPSLEGVALVYEDQTSLIYALNEG